MKIIITGSLGHISNLLTRQLLQTDNSVTVISSNPERKKDIEALGAIAAIGSVKDIHFLGETFSGADAVYCMTPPDFAEPDQVAYYEQIAVCYASAIQHANVKRVLYLSSYGAELPSGTGFITGSYKAEKILDSIPAISLTHIRPTYFYYNLFGFIQMIRSAGFIGAMYGEEDKLAMVSPVDIAHAIAEEIIQPYSTKKVRYVTSDDRTCNEIATVLGRAIGMPDLKWRILPEDRVLQALLSNGFSANSAMNLVELGKATHSGILRKDFERNKHDAGTVVLEDFAKEFAAAYTNNNN